MSAVRTVLGILAVIGLTACTSADPDASSAPPAAVPTQASSDETDVDQGMELATLPAVTYEVYLARDPFEPVRDPVVEPEVGDLSPPPSPSAPGEPPPGDPGPGSPAPGQPGPGQPGPGQPGPGLPPPSAPGAPGERDCRDQGEVVCNGITITLDGVRSTSAGPVATIVVNGSVYEAREGEVFADHFRLLSFDADGVWVAYGDESFRLTERARHLK